MKPTCGEIITALERLAPPVLADKGDRPGLQVGRPDSEVEKVLICLDVTPAVVAEAVRVGARMLVSHHPLIWQPLITLRQDCPNGDLLVELVRRDLCVYAVHTNWDRAPAGLNACLAKVLGLEDVEVLEAAEEEFYCKIVSFVPKDYVDQVRDAMAGAGAGVIGSYSHCSFQTPGVGTFLPLPGSSPFIGLAGRMETVDEVRLEMFLPRRILDGVVQAMRQAHPYEEVAYDVYPLANRETGAGLGAVGSLAGPAGLSDFATQVKRALNVAQVRLTGDPERVVRRIAVCGGSGGRLIPLARQHRAEVLVTGDLKHHQALAALKLGLALIDAGHWATERVSLPFLAEKLQEAVPGLQVVVSSSEHEPWQYF